MVWEDIKASEEKPPVRHPNRELPESQTARFGTLLLMAITMFALLVVAVGGWSTLMGAKVLHIGFVVMFGIYTGYVLKWNRGVLPVIAATAVILAVFALVAGPEWFARDKAGFEEPTLPASLLGIVTLALIPIEMLLVVVSMWGFSQKWNVEEEILPGEAEGPSKQSPPPASPPAAAGA
ncbi:MAG: hypothetical protein HZB14_06795 [Actinobacteria bacterium]|nr:hypothetical protein [Actinomycetota bacterium]